MRVGVVLIFFLPSNISLFFPTLSWGGGSCGAMVLGKLPIPGRPANWDKRWARPTALAVGAGRVV